MKLENRLPDEGINATHEHPLKEFAWLAGGLLGIAALLTILLGFGAQWLAPRIPYEYEARIAGDFAALAPKSDDERAIRDELQALADRIANRMSMPAGMKVHVSYRGAATVNAFATLGGHTVFFGGLLSRLTSEDALAMVMAHEIAHLKHRHPAAALGRGVAVGIVLSLVSAELGRSAAGGALMQAGSVALLSFSRDQEREADEEALRVLAAEYGHVGGALELFDAFAREQAKRAGASLPSLEFLATHPLTANRVESVRRWAAATGTAVDGPRRPLSVVLAKVRSTTDDAAGREAPGGPQRP